MVSELDPKRSHFSLPELTFVQAEYGISIQAIMNRAKQLGMITENRFLSPKIRNLK